MLSVPLDDAYLQRRETAERNRSLKRKAIKYEWAPDEALLERIELVEMIHGEFHEVYLHDPGLDAFLDADTEVESWQSPNEDRSIPF